MKPHSSAESRVLSVENGQVVCRSCGAPAKDGWATIPSARTFAGMPVSDLVPLSRLASCPACGFVFRHPCLSDAEYGRLYAANSSVLWSQQRLRPDQRRVLELLGKYLPGGGGVLDVGCFDGFLLRQLPNCYARHGVEVSEAATGRARDHGVEIVGTSYDSLLSTSRRFDAVVCVDVMEHVSTPANLLKALVGSVRPGGIVIVATGNADHWAWRTLGAFFWYGHFPEHISFVSPRWMADQAQALSVVIEETVSARHEQLTLVETLRRWMQFGVRLPVAWLEQLVPRFIPTYKPHLRCPGPGLFADDFITVIRRC